MTARPALAWRWGVLVVLAVALVLAHGCHAGDHDDELAVCPPGVRATR
jgi:hypothetical protein